MYHIVYTYLAELCPSQSELRIVVKKTGNLTTKRLGNAGNIYFAPIVQL